MSRIIPQATVDALRNNVNISVEIYGIDCQLMVPANLTSLEPTDAYVIPTDIQYKASATKVFIEWSPDTKRLRKLGVFTEDAIPLIVWFKNLPSLPMGSYIKVALEYIPGNFMDTDEFEVTDTLIKGMHDMVVLQGYKAVPRRVKVKK